MSFGNIQEVSKRHNIGGSEWYKLKVGENTVRFLESPVAIAKYFSKGQNKTYYLDEFGAPDEFNGVKKQIRFICWLWDKDENKAVLAELPYSVIKALDTLGNSKNWSFKTIPHYDIVIIKSGEGLATEYATQPTPNTKEVPQTIMDEFKKQKSAKEIAVKMAAKNDTEPDFLADVPPLKSQVE